MLPDIELLTEIKRQIEITPCYECGTNLIFKSVELDEDFEFGKEAVLAVDAHCKPCDTYPAVVLQMRFD